MSEERIASALEKIAKLLALVALKGEKQRDQIATLSAIGYEPREMADILGTTRNTVSVALSNMRKARGTAKKRRARVKNAK